LGAASGDDRRLARAVRAGSEDRFREAEVEHLDRAIRCDLDIGGLEIAVDDALFVRRFERLGNLSRDGEHLGDRHRSARDAVRERLALDQLEHECAEVVSGVSLSFFDAVNRCDVGMIQRRQHARLTLKARDAVSVGRERGRQNLDRDLAPEPAVMGAVDLL
jgi:hypothetical protein